MATLTDDGKQCLLVVLLEEAIALTGGNGLIPVHTLDGKSLGYYVPPKAADERFKLYGPKLTEEDLAELEESFRNPGVVLSAQEWIAELKRQALGGDGTQANTRTRRTVGRNQFLESVSVYTHQTPFRYCHHHSTPLPRVRFTAPSGRPRDEVNTPVAASTYTAASG